MRREKILHINHYSADEIIQRLETQGYFANKKIAYSVLNAIRPGGAPLLVEGDPGVGKTSLAKAVAQMLDIPLVRISCYEDITADKILYDYDYQRQLLVVSALREKLNEQVKNMDLGESIQKIAGQAEFYGRDFLLDRPVLKALTMPGRKVLLIDEIDKADTEIEHALLELLSDFAITIPEYGVIQCQEKDRPIVFLTSNNYRELSQPMLRRCCYLYIEHKSYEEILAIITARVDASDEFRQRVAAGLEALQKTNLKHMVSISKGIEWARSLRTVFGCETAADIEGALPYAVGALAKDRADEKKILHTLKSVPAAGV